MKIGIYVDAPNVAQSGGFKMRYDLLKDYCLRNGIGVSMITYPSYDYERAKDDFEYRSGQQNYFSIVKNFGFKLKLKEVKSFQDLEGNLKKVGSSNVRMTVDIMTQASNFDLIYIISGNGDFSDLVEAVQSMGTRVEVLSFDNVSNKLIDSCDQFTSAYLIPNLVPVNKELSIPENKGLDWGVQGTRVRGVVYEIQYKHTFGFCRFMDTDYNYRAAFFHFSELPENFSPKHGDIYEFNLDRNDKGVLAKNLEFIC